MAWFSWSIADSKKDYREDSINIRIKIFLSRFFNMDNDYMWYPFMILFIVFVSILSVYYGRPSTVYYSLAGIFLRLLKGKEV